MRDFHLYLTKINISFLNPRSYILRRAFTKGELLFEILRKEWVK